jgi:hypothetical protein
LILFSFHPQPTFWLRVFLYVVARALFIIYHRTWHSGRPSSLRELAGGEKGRKTINSNRHWHFGPDWPENYILSLEDIRTEGLHKSLRTDRTVQQAVLRIVFNCPNIKWEV